jgi:hypothetical protein
LGLYEKSLKKMGRPIMPATAVPALDAAVVRKQDAGARTPSQDASRHATDDQILGLMADVETDALSGDERDSRAEQEFEADGPADADSQDAGQREQPDDGGETEQLRAAFEANPELRQAWETAKADAKDANAYREAFATPEEARDATALLADLNRMDALFFSQRPEDHAELARSIAALDPKAFASLAKAIREQAISETPIANRAGSPPGAEKKTGAAIRAEQPPQESQQEQRNVNGAGPSTAQAEFFQAANAAAVQGVLDAIETQVERLLPEGASRSARNRVVGEIYRELDAQLGANRQLSQQVRDAFRSGALDAHHQRAIVSLITGRARQALPGVAKRVMNEWTSTIVAANQDRRARQHAAERRVDIAGSSGGAGEGRRSMAPRDIDYARLSDGDILNL